MTDVWVTKDGGKISAVYSWAVEGAKAADSENPAVLAFLAQNSLPRRISKNAIWERATDAEATIMDALLSAQPIRIRRIYDGATHIEPDHELFGLLTQALTAAFGPDRAAELLAPTD